MRLWILNFDSALSKFGYLSDWDIETQFEKVHSIIFGPCCAILKLRQGRLHKLLCFEKRLILLMRQIIFGHAQITGGFSRKLTKGSFLSHM